MDVDEAQARMQEIQRIMERATLFTLLPGMAAVIGGVLVLAGCAVSYAMFRSLDFAGILHLSFASQAAFCAMWFVIGVIGVLLEVILTTRAAARQQLVPANRPMRVAAFSLTPSVVVAMVLTFKFLIRVEPRAEEIQYIVPVWMMLYGTGVYTAGLFSIRPPRILGLAFLASGIVALLCFPGYGVVSAALSFGLLHVVFGLYILQKQRQTAVS
jgi:membrane-associated HD superfamily phosphohydrolase